MQRSAKKTEQAIIKALNNVCETLKDKYIGFTWLTHFVDYNKFPQSLKIVFVFETNQHLLDAKNHKLFETLFELSESQLKKESIHIKRIDKSIFFDSEENGADFNDSNWSNKYS